MENQLFQDLPQEERREQLEANADAVEYLGYSKPISPEEVERLKESLSSIQIKIDETQDELKDYVMSVKAEIKELKTKRRKITDNLKSKTEYVEEDCYKMVDEERREVGYYNLDGYLVYKRPARKDELQKTIFQDIRNTGTE